jgi:type 1 fimbriae regulatory protein FimB/type 1 fimbriae regulatory protein FimE
MTSRKKLLPVMPIRPTNKSLRTREHLTPAEVDKLIDAAKKHSGKSRKQSHRNATLILLAYKHGLRAKELAELKWDQIELGRNATFYVWRAKSGKAGSHPLEGDEVRALRELQRNWSDSDFVFATERQGPFTPAAINRLIVRIGKQASFPFPIHIHMLRHSCGYALANKGHDTRLIQDWLGHRSIEHTVRYTELAPIRFKGIWR